jgi:hypothetical protein
MRAAPVGCLRMSNNNRNRELIMKRLGWILVLMVAVAGCGKGDRSEAVASAEPALPPDIVKGARVHFYVTNDHPFRFEFDQYPMVEKVSGNWVYMSCVPKSADGKAEPVKTWVNFNNVVWFQVQK